MKTESYKSWLQVADGDGRRRWSELSLDRSHFGEIVNLSEEMSHGVLAAGGALHSEKDVLGKCSWFVTQYIGRI